MLKKLLLTIVSGILGLWLASQFVAGVYFTGPISALLTAGAVLGLINFFVKPLLNLITLPLRVITLGFFGLIINVAIVWVIDLFFPELIIRGIEPLFWTTLIIWGTNIVLPLFAPKRKRQAAPELNK